MNFYKLQNLTEYPILKYYIIYALISVLSRKFNIYVKVLSGIILPVNTLFCERRDMKTILILLPILLLCGCGKKYEFSTIFGSSGRFHSIELKHRKGSTVVFPDIHHIHNGPRFITGLGSARYLDDEYLFGASDDPITNQLWFIVDKKKGFPECFACLTTNREAWLAECNRLAVTTNLLDVQTFMKQSSKDRIFDL